MSINELTANVSELRELRRMTDEIQAEVDAIQDKIRAHMNAAGVDTLAGADYKITWKEITSSRFDTTAFKKENPEIAAMYTKTSKSKRFILA